ncbi:MAG TPA: peptidylprolyl isomerase [Candidatus Dormibacteraeota bacterium]|nr:peptidylprolyl isomerase [Candidatus Dormibacteraeota bacterium]
MMKVYFFAAVLIFASLTATQQSMAQGGETQSTTKTPAHRSATATATYDRALLKPALLKAQAPDTYQVKFTTTKGEFVVTVTRAWAPIGADRFYNLVRHHFYDNASFFRVINGFMAQFGVSAYPQVSAAWEKAEIKDDPVTQSNLKGFITFAAASEPNTRTTQVFINLVDNKRLDASRFAPFGQVTEGMDVVEALNSEYGEGAPDGKGPDQEQIGKTGKPYLDKSWPRLDSIKTAVIVGAPAPAKKPVAKPAAKATAKAAAPTPQK